MAGEGPVPNRIIRQQVARTWKFAAVSLCVGRRKLNNHSLRAAGASLMFDVGFDFEIDIRRGLRVSTTFCQYLRRGEMVMSCIGRGMSSVARNYGRAGGERGRCGAVSDRVTYYRLVDMAKRMSGGIRRSRLPGMARGGRVPAATLLKFDRPARRQATVEDIQAIFDGLFRKL